MGKERSVMLRIIVGGGVLLLFLAGSVSAQDGAAIFKEKCAKCHGDTGKSDTATGKSMKVPAISGDAKVAAMSEDDIVKGIKENKKHKPPVKELADADLKAVAGVVKKLAAGN
jgi:mono/diheme cytochrome c family protein